MNVIKLKKSILKFYVSLVAIIIITFSVSIACFIYGYVKFNEGIEQFKDYFLIPVGLINLLIGILSVRIYLINLTTLKIRNNQLLYKNKVISKDIINNISFRIPIVLWGGYQTIGTIILLKNGEKIKIFDVFYSNANYFHKFINDNFLKNNDTISSLNDSKIYNDDLNSNKIIILKGNLIFSYRSLYLIWAPLVFSLVIFFNPPSTPFSLGEIILFSIFIIAYFLIQFHFLFTLKLTNSAIIVKHYFLAFNKQFDLNNIHEIQFLYRAKIPNQLKITTNDFKTYSFFMGTLRENNEWILLKNYLESKQIKTINRGVI